MSAGLLKPLTSFHCEISIVSNTSATRLAKNNCCLRWELCIYRNTVVVSDQNCNLHFLFLEYLYFQAHCHDCRLQFQLGVERCLIGAIMFFAIKKTKSADYASGFQRRYATAHIVSSNAPATPRSSVLSRSLFKHCLLMVVSPTNGNYFFHLKIFFVTRLPIVQINFGSLLMRTLREASNPINSNAEDNSKITFLGVVGASTSFFVPLHI